MSAESKHQALAPGIDLDNPLGFGDPRVLVSGMDFHTNWCSGHIRVFSSGFSFGCPETPPDPNPPRFLP